jgi:hypothetical protein
MSHYNDCPHTPKYPDLALVPTMQEALSQCVIVEDVPEVAKQRALTSADGITTRIDSSYWRTLNDAQKAAVIAHERAHPCIGMEVACEGCADKVGGYFMRAWGYCPAVVRQSYSTLRVRRDLGHGDIADNAAVGARFAERGLAGKGMLGMSSDETSARLLKDRGLLTLTKPAPTSPTPTTTTSLSPPTTATTTSTTTSGTTSTRTDLIASRLSTRSAPTTPVEPAPVGASADPVSVPTPVTEQAVGQATSSRDPGGPAFGVPSGETATPVAGAPGDDKGSDIAGDVVSAVLGESARPHAGKVLIATGIAVTLAVVLVAWIRR